ncbi:hypothetical protein GJ744_006441 [Endocarpon pusillum]|uniref:2'-phosphotransferase n=1 Tax=Endocarpon pusillum TaxID=364733 RepID=A0A8H7E0T3_9EURO|nr:hypothetical protein GJ744_006441 [Endocarpon pusillum]
MGGASGGRGEPSRRVRVSKAMSWLLRHGAHREGIPIDQQGYVNVADMLKWHKMGKGMGVTFEEILDEVQNNEKQRFALLYMPPELVSAKKQTTVTDMKDATVEGGSSDLIIQNDIDQKKRSNPIHAERAEDIEVEGEALAATRSPTVSASATTLALQSAFSTPTPNPSHFLIRATQGHSINTVSASAYLTPITLSTPSSIPSTVVHGTFYAAWDSILRTGGLKPMSRVHVHFATGPSLGSLLDSATTKTAEGEPKNAASGLLGEKKAVISGMRSDAQILIYINILKALEMGIPFWMSENGVVLSEGLETEATGKGMDKGMNKKYTVPVECWEVVVELKEGLGVLWRDGKVVRELPEHLKKMGWPHRKEPKRGHDGRDSDGGGGQRHGVNGAGKKVRGKPSRGRGGKPELRVERDGNDLG